MPLPSDLGAGLCSWRSACRCGCRRSAPGKFLDVRVQYGSQCLDRVRRLEAERAQFKELIKRDALPVALRARHRFQFVPRGKELHERLAAQLLACKPREQLPYLLGVVGAGRCMESL